MISRETIQKVEDSLKIEEVISDFVTLRRRGASFTACCPFHNEKTPSFHVSPSKGIFKCFGCGKSGSAISFVMEYEHCSYADAIRYIAKKYHIAVEEEELTAEQIVAKQKTESLMLVTEFAHKFFIDQLKTREGQAVAMAYYYNRGLEDETITKEGLGWAPSGARNFTEAALKAGYKEEYLVETGLSIKRDDGSLIDRFRERVMFPIYSVSGRVIAFSGRTLKSDNPAKYVNSPESEIYIKSKALLGIYHAKSEISKLDKCYLVEGNIDVITLHQLGIQNVVASCGTSLTAEQIRLIHRFTSNLTIMYDGDNAGIKAALRGTDMVLEEGMDVRIVLLPPGEDPDSFGRTHTLEEFQSYIAEHEQDFISFKSERLMLQAGKDPLKRAEVINEIADAIALIPDPVKRSVCVQDCARKFRLNENILYNRIVTQREKAPMRTNAPQSQPSEGEPIHEELEQSSGAQTGRFENLVLEPVERDILSYLLRYASNNMEFPTDSPYYSPEPISVADFIVSALDADNYEMANSAYQHIYSAFKEMYYDEGLSEDIVVRRLLEGEDRGMAGMVSDLAIDKYDITVKRFSAALTSLDSWLVHNVPETMIMLACKRLESQIEELKLKIKQPEVDQMAILQEIARLQKTQKLIKDKLNKEKYGEKF